LLLCGQVWQTCARVCRACCRGSSVIPPASLARNHAIRIPLVTCSASTSAARIHIKLRKKDAQRATPGFLSFASFCCTKPTSTLHASMTLRCAQDETVFDLRRTGCSGQVCSGQRGSIVGRLAVLSLSRVRQELLSATLSAPEEFKLLLDFKCSVANGNDGSVSWSLSALPYRLIDSR